jgi:hypothetical protein
MFFPALFKAEDSDCRYALRKRIRAAILFLLEAPSRLVRAALDGALAELNSCRDSFAGQAPLLAGRQPCFG